VWRGCAAEHGPSERQAKRRLKQESMAGTVAEEACRQICLVEQQRGTERAETRRVTVLGIVVSCGGGDLIYAITQPNAPSPHAKRPPPGSRPNAVPG
jgi:hypothetical protein